MSGSFINQLPAFSGNVTSAVVPVMLTTAPQQPGNTFAVGAGTGANQFAAGNDSRIVGAAQKSNNLSDMASGATALANIGGVTSAQAAAAAPIQTVVGQTGTISLSVLTANGVAPSDSPVFTTLATIGGASTNALSITPGGSSSSATVLALSGTGALQLPHFTTTPVNTYAQSSGSLVPVAKFAGNFSGTMGSSANAPFQFTIPSDTMDTTGNPGPGSPAIQLNRNFGGAGTKGSRSGIRSNIGANSAITGDASNQQYVAMEAWINSTVNVGGTGSGTSSAGSIYSLNPQAVLKPGATFFSLLNGLGEIDIAVIGTTQPVTLGGTVTTSDTLTVTFTSASITGSPVSITYTIGASNTLAMCAQGLSAAINNNSALTAAGVAAVGSGSTLNLYWPTQNTVTPSVSVGGAATETMVIGSLVAGASTDVRLGASFVRLSTDSTRGISNDAALMFADQQAPVSGQWKQGIVFGPAQGTGAQWPIMPTGTIIGAAVQASHGSTGKNAWLTSNYAGWGIDFRSVNFSAASGASLAVPGASFGGGGILTLSNTLIGPISTGLKIDLSGSRGSAAISAGGGGGAGVATNNYFPGDLIFDAYNGQYIVSTVNASTGAVTALTTVVAPYVQGSTPSNPVSTTGGSGSGLTLTITWTSTNTLQLNASGGAVQFGSGCFTANGSVATALSSVGPTGSHTTVQEWLTFTNAGGTVRYIPAF